MTPYAAIQAQDFHTPAYSETDLTGGGFGLSYNAMTAPIRAANSARRFDDLTAWGAMPLMLRARLAWAHDWVSNPALNASFESLPGTSFTVNGAPVPHELGADLGRRAIVLHAELVAARQVRRRVRLASQTLRRLGNAALRVVSKGALHRLVMSPF